MVSPKYNLPKALPGPFDEEQSRALGLMFFGPLLLETIARLVVWMVWMIGSLKLIIATKHLLEASDKFKGLGCAQDMRYVP